MANWNRILTRGNVEDRRRFSPVVGTISLGTVALIIAFNILTGGNINTILKDLSGVSTNTGQVQNANTINEQDSYKDFASTVIGSANDIWEQKFKENGLEYVNPKLVLFRNATNSGCGLADSRMGPHYCPEDQTIYLDETFFDVLVQKLGAKGGDVAQAYVMAHEVGHHAQKLLGSLEKQNSIAIELQADCFAGIWANSLKDKQVFEPGEINEAMDAASAVGDDRVQKATEGRVNPENWTHGSSSQRVSWFTKGFETGSIESCDTFK